MRGVPGYTPGGMRGVPSYTPVGMVGQPMYTRGYGRGSLCTPVVYPGMVGGVPGGIPGYGRRCTLVGIHTLVYTLPYTPWVYPALLRYWRHDRACRRRPAERALGSRREYTLGESLSSLSGPSKV